MVFEGVGDSDAGGQVAGLGLVFFTEAGGSGSFPVLVRKHLLEQPTPMRVEAAKRLQSILFTIAINPFLGRCAVSFPD